MKTIEFELNGQTLHLCLNGTALFDAYDRFGTENSLLDHIRGSDKASYSALCWFTWKLGEQGELVRRFQGHERSRIPGEAEIRAMLAPTDVPAAKMTVAAAIGLGFGREIAEEERRVDLGLQELEKKNGSRPTRARYHQVVSQFLGLSLREGMLLTPGQIFDLQALEIRRRGLIREDE